MIDEQREEPQGRPNLISWGSLALGLAAMIFFSHANWKLAPYGAVLAAGLVGLFGIILGIAGVMRARILRRGLGVGIAAILLNSLFLCFPLSRPAMGLAKKEANEASAIQSIRAISQAQLQYESAYPVKGYACSLRALGGDPNAGPPTAEAAEILPGDLASGVKSGYIFAIGNCARGTANAPSRVTGYTITAVPEAVGRSGNRGFCGDAFGVILYDPTGGTNCVQPVQ